MRIDVLTLFPEMFEGVFGASILGKAKEKGIVSLHTVNFRDYANNKHNTVDDYPYGGGGGMVLKPEPIFAAVEQLVQDAEQQVTQDAEQERAHDANQEQGQEIGWLDAEVSKGPVISDSAQLLAQGAVRQDADDTEEHMPKDGDQQHALASDEQLVQDVERQPTRDHEQLVHVRVKKPRVILMCPQGETFTQSKAEELSQEEHLVFICGHYEGYDERIRQYLVTDELSIGDYVLTGGELPAMVVIDSVVRLLPGVLGNETSAITDSFSTGLLEHPHYTRPPVFRDWEVPDVLLSGHHVKIEEWRRKQALRRTWERRPDLLNDLPLTAKDKKWLEEIKNGGGQ